MVLIIKSNPHKVSKFKSRQFRSAYSQTHLFVNLCTCGPVSQSAPHSPRKIMSGVDQSSSLEYVTTVKINRRSKGMV